MTPAESELPRNYEGILDHLHSRAIALDNGITSAALISLDAGGMYSFEVVFSRVQPGCAESAIVNGIFDLMAHQQSKEKLH